MSWHGEGPPAGDDFASIERAGWESAAAGYGFFSQATRLVVRPVLDAAGVTAGDRVVDVAAGLGGLAAGAVERGAEPVAVDRSATMLRQLGGSDRDLPLVRADGMALPFADATFDMGVAGFYLNHLDDPAAGLRELRRVVRPGGWVAASVWDVPERARHTGLVVEAVALAAGTLETPAPARPLPTALHALRQLIADAGFVQPGTTQVTGTLRVRDSDELLDGLASSTVRTAALVRQQPAHVQRRLREHLRGLCERYRQGPSRLDIPVAAVVLSGQRPSARSPR